jgi:predicted secreted protein
MSPLEESVWERETRKIEQTAHRERDSQVSKTFAAAAGYGYCAKNTTHTQCHASAVTHCHALHVRTVGKQKDINNRRR